MKRLLFSALLVLNTLCTGFVHAEKADAGKPTNIEADQMVYDDVKQVNTFTGNVVLTRGTLVLKAHKVTIRQDPQGYQSATIFAAPGNVATFRQKRDGGPDLWIEGQAQRIEFDGKTDVVKLYTNAKLRRLDGARVTDELEGEHISYDSQSEYLSVNNTASGDSKPDAGRVRAVIQPRSERKEK